MDLLLSLFFSGIISDLVRLLNIADRGCSIYRGGLHAEYVRGIFGVVDDEFGSGLSSLKSWSCSKAMDGCFIVSFLLSFLFS